VPILILTAPGLARPFGPMIRSFYKRNTPMFSIEHEFDTTVITLVDEGTTPLQ
tara:strand:+ start:998 stop:1156 length:159 start_codon:yes stop_codon:yes gene_type:complete